MALSWQCEHGEDKYCSGTAKLDDGTQEPCSHECHDPDLRFARSMAQRAREVRYANGIPDAGR